MRDSFQNINFLMISNASCVISLKVWNRWPTGKYLLNFFNIAKQSLLGITTILFCYSDDTFIPDWNDIAFLIWNEENPTKTGHYPGSITDPNAPHIFISKFEHEIISVFETETGYAILKWKLGNSYTPLEEIYSWRQTFGGNKIKNVTFFLKEGLWKLGGGFIDH